jgi:predicted nuclease of predicted toxin-antitoxin system
MLVAEENVSKDSMFDGFRSCFCRLGADETPLDLVAQLSTGFPGSTHVVLENLEASDDQVISEFAKNADYIIVSKNSDLRQLSFLRGHPPKTVWLRIGNAPTKAAADLLIPTLSPPSLRTSTRHSSPFHS